MRCSAFLSRSRLFAAVATCVVTGCTQGTFSPTPAVCDNATATETGELRELKRQEALDDFSQIVSTMRGVYGPLERKEQRYGFSFESAVRKTQREIKRGRTDADYVGAMQRFLARFKDGHVGFFIGINSDSSFGYNIPLVIQPFENRFLVTVVAPELAASKGIALGDEVVAFDDTHPAELARDLSAYSNAPNPATLLALASRNMTRRVWYLSEALLPEPGSNAVIQLVRIDGTKYSVEIPWTQTSLLPKTPLRDTPKTIAPSLLSQAKVLANPWIAENIGAKTETNKIGAVLPFYLTRAFLDTYQPVAVRPSDKNLTDFGTPECTGGGFACYRLFSAIYQYQGKKILIARVPSYSPGEAASPGSANDVGYFQALLFEFRDQADVLVLDDTHNPGGDVGYVVNLYSSLLKAQGPAFGYRYNSDRQWLSRFRQAEVELLANPDPVLQALGKVVQQRGDVIEKAYDSGEPLTRVLPFADLPDAVDPIPQGWTKPFIVLADELSFSGGDALPMLVKASKQGVIFGARTAGLGGSVESAVTTTNSQGEVRLTRGLFVATKADGAYVDADFVEDNGVVPDVPYTVKVDDYRQGYLPYVKAFSDLAVAQKP
jgi:Peptidase family S41/PDZ domain